MSIVWSSQVTHTAAALIGGEHYLATYTLGERIYAVGMVFDGASRDLTVPPRRIELGTHTVEQAARAACEAFCRGEVDPERPVAAAAVSPPPAPSEAEGAAPAAPVESSAAAPPRQGLEP